MMNQIQDTAHTKGVGISIAIARVERTTIQVTFIVISATVQCAGPYLVRIAIAIVGARAAAVWVALQGRLYFSFRFRYFRSSQHASEAKRLLTFFVQSKCRNLFNGPHS